jgi:fructokinase
MTATRELDVVCFGEAIVDFYPEPAGGGLDEVDLFRRHLGGSPANVAVTLARLGLASGLVTLVGADPFGRYLLTQLARAGVDAAGVGTHRTARTGITFVGVGPAGERSYTFYRHPSADMLLAPVDLAGGVVTRGHVFHFGSSTLAREPARAATLSALAEAREAGCLVACDPNFRPHLWAEVAEAPALIRQTLADCDIAKVADEEAPALVGQSEPEAAARALRELGVRLAIVSLGARGCYFEGPTGAGYVPGERVAVVDTSGAGDAFMAGLLAALVPHLKEAPLDRLEAALLRAACAEGNRLGALACTRLGATAALAVPPRGA